MNLSKTYDCLPPQVSILVPLFLNFFINNTHREKLYINQFIQCINLLK